MSVQHNKPYEGTSRKLVISIDIGTTFTASSFCILQPGKVPKFEEILRWPKQTTPDAKIPSVIYYDKHGKPRSFGAETDDDDNVMSAESEGWHKAAWWKLWLRPDHLHIIRGLTLPPLPKHKTVDDIFVDYLGYIKEQVKQYITSTYGDGSGIWSSLFPSMYCILTTPNGWEGKQQHRLREAAIRAGLVDESGGRRIRFVTEAEAAVLYAIDSGSVEDWLIKDGNLILCDCGGGTVDITGYAIKSLEPLRLEESASSRCFLAGAVFITRAAEAYLRKKLAGTEWGDPDSISRAVLHFDRIAKKKFENPDTVSWVQLDGHKSDPSLGILRGRLKIPGKDMTSFFEPCVQAIKDGLEIAFENGNGLADKIILVGGLASSPYVHSQLIEWGEENGISVSRPDGPTMKAVANGALAWYIDDTVASRVAKFYYGCDMNIAFDMAIPGVHRRKTTVSLSGEVTVPDAWSCIVKKDTNISSGQEFFRSFCVYFSENSTNFEYTSDILVYRRAKPPMFTTFLGKSKLQPGFEVICKITADLKECFENTEILESPSGKKYRKVKFDIGISLGETEVIARMRWKNSEGEYCYGPATIAYD